MILKAAAFQPYSTLMEFKTSIYIIAMAETVDTNIDPHLFLRALGI